MADLRISGLATGMDTDSLVKDLMRAERAPLDKITQKKQTLEWKRDSYREMNTLLLSLREESLKMRLPSSFLTKIASSSNDSRISATSDASAGNSTYTFDKVERLASAATNASAGSISGTGEKIDTKARIFSVQDKFAGGKENFQWKVTDDQGVNETVKVKTAGKSFSLSKLSGGKIVTDSIPAQITITDKEGNSTIFDVKKEKSENIGENEVYLNADTGQLTFGKEISAGSSFEVSYKYIQKDTLTASTDKKEYQLSNAGITGTKGLKTIQVTTYEKDSDGKIKNDISGNPIVLKVENYSTDTDPASNNFLSYDPSTGIYKSKDGKVEIDGNSGSLKFTDNLDAGAKIEAVYSYSFFEIDMKTHTSKGEVQESIKINGADSLSTVISRINSSGLGVSAFYDEYSDKVTMTRTETGDFNPNEYDSEGKLTQKNSEMNFMNDPFLKNILQLHGKNELGGEDAKFSINGLETGRHSNTFTLNGVTFTLKETFSNSEPSVKIGTKTDTDKVYNTIKSFIDKYNETIDKINKKIGEERYRDYTPLTQEQREALSEKEVEMWEEKAKSGLIRRDQTLSSGLDKMRSDFYAAVNFEGDSQYKQLTAIGITTTNLYNVNKGKLEINEDKLRQAIENDPDGVYKLFANDSENYAEKGIARRLRDSMTTTIQAIEETAGNDIKTNSQFTIGKNLDDISNRVKDLEARLKQVEERYYKQFTAMETAVQKMNQQSSYLMQQLGLGQQ